MSVCYRESSLHTTYSKLRSSTLLSQLLKQKHNKPKTQFFNKLHWSDIILISIHLPWLSIVPNIILEIKLH